MHFCLSHPFVLCEIEKTICSNEASGWTLIQNNVCREKAIPRGACFLWWWPRPFSGKGILRKSHGYNIYKNIQGFNYSLWKYLLETDTSHTPHWWKASNKQTQDLHGDCTGFFILSTWHKRETSGQRKPQLRNDSGQSPVGSLCGISGLMIDVEGFPTLHSRTPGCIREQTGGPEKWLIT